MKNGGPAFPLKTPILFYKKGHENCVKQVNELVISGMSLRDYFAAHWIQIPYMAPRNEGYAEIIAKQAYEVADAMLNERDK